MSKCCSCDELLNIWSSEHVLLVWWIIGSVPKILIRILVVEPSIINKINDHEVVVKLLRLESGMMILGFRNPNLINWWSIHGSSEFQPWDEGGSDYMGPWINHVVSICSREQIRRTLKSWRFFGGRMIKCWFNHLFENARLSLRWENLINYDEARDRPWSHETGPGLSRDRLTITSWKSKVFGRVLDLIRAIVQIRSKLWKLMGPASVSQRANLGRSR